MVVGERLEIKILLPLIYNSTTIASNFMRDEEDKKEEEEEGKERNITSKPVTNSSRVTDMLLSVSIWLKKSMSRMEWRSMKRLSRIMGCTIALGRKGGL